MTTEPADPSALLVGRHTEVAAAEAAIARGVGVVFAGCAGAGRTCLGREFAGRLAAVGHRITRIAGTRAGATIPFGAFARFLDVGAGKDLARQLRHLTDVLSRGAAAELVSSVAVSSSMADIPTAGRRSVLIVDDAHLLDAASATVVHELALAGDLLLILTVRTGQDCADAVSRVWRDGFAVLVEVGELDRGSSGELVAAMLGAAVDSFTVGRMYHLSSGNPLALHELVNAARVAGGLRLTEGVWRWDGEWRTSADIGNTLAARLDGCGATERDAMAYTALARSLAADVLTDLTSGDVVESLCERGLLRSDPGGQSVTLAYPLYGEALVRTAQPVTLRRLRRTLAAHLDGAGDLLARVTLLSDAGDRVSDVDLIAAANDAARRLDAQLAERLATRATPEAPGRALALAEALSLMRRFERVEVVLAEAELAAEASGAADLNVAVARLINQIRGLRRADLAEAHLARLAQRTDTGPMPIVRLLRVYLATLTRRYADAAAACAEDPLLSDVDIDGPAGWAVYQLAGAYFQLGRAGESFELLSRHDRADAPAETALAVHFGLTGALVGMGRPDEAATQVDALTEWGSRAGWPPATCLGAAGRGGVLVYRGMYRPASRELEMAAALARESAPGTSRHWILCQYAHAEAGLGRIGPAQALLDAAAAYRADLDLPYLAEQEGRAEAFVRACAGHTSAAIAILEGLVGQSLEHGAWSQTLEAAHLLARLGRARQASAIIAPMPIFTDYARACVRHILALAESGTQSVAMAAVALEFERIGAFGLAAEAADVAADRLRRRGPDGAAAAAVRMRDRLIALTGGPALSWWAVRRRPTLSPREQEIAKLAAAGQSSADIAADLLLSVRTVENHLQRAYMKLGVASRTELRTTLADLDSVLTPSWASALSTAYSCRIPA